MCSYNLCNLTAVCQLESININVIIIVIVLCYVTKVEQQFRWICCCCGGGGGGVGGGVVVWCMRVTN